jgi:hypothetical protein
VTVASPPRVRATGCRTELPGPKRSLLTCCRWPALAPLGDGYTYCYLLAVGWQCRGPWNSEAILIRGSTQLDDVAWLAFICLGIGDDDTVEVLSGSEHANEQAARTWSKQNFRVRACRIGFIAGRTRRLW